MIKAIGMLVLLVMNLAEPVAAATIHGFVREKATKEPIVMGNVWIKDSNFGTTTNVKGYYVLSALPAGRYEIYFRYIGYRTHIEQITIDREIELELDVYLEPEPIALPEATVVAERDRRELDIKPSQIVVPAPQLRAAPQIAEPDLFRTIQMLPGVATLSDFSAGLYVRGGSPDQNLILLDHIDVYNPNHLFGFFSSFNTDAIKSVELLKGGFPVMYAGRLSSVLNVINKEGNREKFQGVARLSLLSSNATLEGPWRYGSWMVSGRRTYLDLAAKLVDFDLPYYFYDGHAKINFDIDRNNQASLSFYAGNDKLDLSQNETDILLDWGNKTFSAQWMHVISSQLFSHFVLAGSRFDSDSEVKFDDISFGISNRITDLAIKGWITYSPSILHTFDFGLEAKNLQFDLRNKIADLAYKKSFAGNSFALYVQHNYKLTRSNILQTGMRFDFYSDGNYSRLTPQLSYQYLFNDRINMTLSYGRYAQFINLVYQEGLSFADMWFPVDETFAPGRADHFILGFNYDDLRKLSLNIEAYYKRYANISEYRFRAAESQGIDRDYDRLTASDIFLSGKASAYGIDVYVRNQLGGLKGWLGYSFNWVKKQVKGYNFDQPYFPPYDRRHTITAAEEYRLAQKWRLNFALKFGTGQPYTEASGRYQALNPNGTIYDRTLEAKKNSYRLPPYLRFDIGLTHHRTIFGLRSELYLQAINVFNFKNVWFRYYDFDTNPATRKEFYMLPRIPTVGVSVMF